MRPAKEIEEQTTKNLIDQETEQIKSGNEASESMRNRAIGKLPGKLIELQREIDREMEKPKRYDNEASLHIGEGYEANILAHMIAAEAKKNGYRVQIDQYWGYDRDGVPEGPSSYTIHVKWGLTFAEYHKQS